MDPATLRPPRCFNYPARHHPLISHPRRRAARAVQHLFDIIDAKERRYIVKGDVVGILARCGAQVQVVYPSERDVWAKGRSTLPA